MAAYRIINIYHRITNDFRDYTKHLYTFVSVSDPSGYNIIFVSRRHRDPAAVKRKMLSSGYSR